MHNLGIFTILFVCVAMTILGSKGKNKKPQVRLIVINHTDVFTCLCNVCCVKEIRFFSSKYYSVNLSFLLPIRSFKWFMFHRYQVQRFSLL